MTNAIENYDLVEIKDEAGNPTGQYITPEQAATGEFTTVDSTDHTI